MKYPQNFSSLIFILSLSMLTSLTTELETNATIDQAQTFDTINKPLLAQSNRTQRIQFQPGTTSKIVSDAVVRGTRDIYLVRANASQTMNISLTSTENNAVFDLVSPDGTPLRKEVVYTNTVLPLTGDYKIVIGGTRGNATYQLYVEIHDTEKAETLITKNFKITIRSRCAEGEVVCNNVLYEGININTKKSIQLVGKTLHRTCADGITPCQFLGYEFRNGNYRYLITNDGILFVYQGNKLLLEERGTWQN